MITMLGLTAAAADIETHAASERLTRNSTIRTPSACAAGFTIHSLRHAFKTFCINSRIPREVVDAWQGHAPDRSAGGAYYKLTPEESQRFMKQVPFGTGEPAAPAGEKEV